MSSVSYRTTLMGNSYIGPYAIENKLGKGHFGKSRQCKTTDNFFIAAKIIEVLPQANKEKIMKDVNYYYNNLQTVSNLKERHPLVRFRQTMHMEDPCFAIISDYCPQGNLEKNLLIRKEMQQSLLQMKQIAQGVEWLHRKGTPHGDLKPSNILVKEGQLFLIDVLPPFFKNCIRLRDTDAAFDYFPPQYFSGIVSFSSDVWSLGIIFLEMFYGRRIRELQELKGIQKPSTVHNYPSSSLLAGVTHPNLQSLLIVMLKEIPNERIQMREVVSRLEEMTDMHLETRRRVAVRQQAQEEMDKKQPVHLALSFDNKTPYFKHFSLAGGKVIRIDQQKIRVQAISKEKIPLGLWTISAAIVSYGTWNDQVAIGFTTEQRRDERMSGDIDQAGCIAYWSSFANKKSNICLNGEWNDEPLPFLREGKGVLQMVVDTEDRSINWYVDSQWVRQTSMPRYFWDQSLYFFVGLMGKGCSVQLLQPNLYL